jgi:hypothetical protein
MTMTRYETTQQICSTITDVGRSVLEHGYAHRSHRDDIVQGDFGANHGVPGFELRIRPLDKFKFVRFRDGQNDVGFTHIGPFGRARCVPFADCRCSQPEV